MAETGYVDLATLDGTTDRLLLRTWCANLATNGTFFQPFTSSQITNNDGFKRLCIVQSILLTHNGNTEETISGPDVFIQQNANSNGFNAADFQTTSTTGLFMPGGYQVEPGHTIAIADKTTPIYLETSPPAGSGSAVWYKPSAQILFDPSDIPGTGAASLNTNFDIVISYVFVEQEI